MALPLLACILAGKPFSETPCRCLRNVVALFHVLEKELAWRKETGRPEGYRAMKMSKPIVAVGPEHALEDETLVADFFRMFISAATGPPNPPPEAPSTSSSDCRLVP